MKIMILHDYNGSYRVVKRTILGHNPGLRSSNRVPPDPNRIPSSISDAKTINFSGFWPILGRISDFF